MAKLLPILLAALGLVAGTAAGLMLRPDKLPPTPAESAEGAAPAPRAAASDDGPDAEAEYVAFSNQFVIPLMAENRVEAMVVLTVSLEVAPGQKEAVYNREPRLRDALLQVLFDHANAGGFERDFMHSSGLDTLRTALREMAVTTLGPVVRDVLITDLVKQEV